MVSIFVYFNISGFYVVFNLEAFVEFFSGSQNTFGIFWNIEISTSSLRNYFFGALSDHINFQLI